MTKSMMTVMVPWLMNASVELSSDWPSIDIEEESAWKKMTVTIKSSCYKKINKKYIEILLNIPQDSLDIDRLLWWISLCFVPCRESCSPESSAKILNMNIKKIINLKEK